MNKILCSILIIILLVIGVILMLSKKDKNIENEMRIKHVSMDEIVQIMNENTDYIILDVRTIAE